MKILLLLMGLFLFNYANAQLGDGQKEPSKGQKKANKGQYEEADGVKEFPYTLFVKTKESFDIQIEISHIKNLILSEVEFEKKFNKIFDSASVAFSSIIKKILEVTTTKMTLILEKELAILQRTVKMQHLFI